MRTTSWWGACEEVEDRLPDCRHARLRRRLREFSFPRSPIVSSIFRKLSGYAIYQRTRDRMTSGSKGLPLNAIVISRPDKPVIGPYSEQHVDIVKNFG